MYQALLRCQWTNSIVNNFRVADWAAEFVVIASNVLSYYHVLSTVASLANNKNLLTHNPNVLNI